MSVTITIFAPRPLSLAVVRSAARGFRVSSHGESALCSIETTGLQLVVGTTDPAARDERIAATRSFVMTRCHVADDAAVSQLEDARYCYVLQAQSELAGRFGELVLSLTRLCDGVCFDGARLRDGGGRILASSTQDSNEDSTTLDLGPEHTGRFAEPPSAERVLRRVWVLAAVSMRGFLEDSPMNSMVEPFSRVWTWLERNDAMSELEDAERGLLSTAHGRLSMEQRSVATWRGEGLGVLAWALHATQMVDHQTPFDPGAIASSMGFLADVLPAVVRTPQLRSATELDWQRRRLYGIHWRLREFWLRPRPFDFRSYARTAPHGAFDLIGIPLLNDDLAIAGRPLAHAARDLAQRSHDMVVERHQAIGWVLGKHHDYSRVDTSV